MRAVSGRYLVLVNGAVRGCVLGHFQYIVPQGARAQHARQRGSVGVAQPIDLPVHAGIGSSQARIALGRGQEGLSRLVDAQAGCQLVQLRHQSRPELLRHMLAKQLRQTPAGNGDGDHDPDQGAHQQPDAQGARRPEQGRQWGHTSR